MGAKELIAGHTRRPLVPHDSFVQHQKHHPDVGLRAARCCPCLGEALPVIIKKGKKNQINTRTQQLKSTHENHVITTSHELVTNFMCLD